MGLQLDGCRLHRTTRLEDTQKAGDAENHDSKWQHPPAHQPWPRAQSELLTQGDKGGHQHGKAALQRSNHQIHLQTKKEGWKQSTSTATAVQCCQCFQPGCSVSSTQGGTGIKFIRVNFVLTRE